MQRGNYGLTVFYKFLGELTPQMTQKKIYSVNLLEPIWDKSFALKFNAIGFEIWEAEILMGLDLIGSLFIRAHFHPTCLL